MGFKNFCPFLSGDDDIILRVFFTDDVTNKLTVMKYLFSDDNEYVQIIRNANPSTFPLMWHTDVYLSLGFVFIWTSWWMLHVERDLLTLYEHPRSFHYSILWFCTIYCLFALFLILQWRRQNDVKMTSKWRIYALFGLNLIGFLWVIITRKLFLAQCFSLTMTSVRIPTGMGT